MDKYLTLFNIPTPFEAKGNISSLNILIDRDLLKLYRDAVEACTDHEFIHLILQEVNRRHLTLVR